MKQIVIVGVDVSKATLDLYVRPLNLAYRVANTKAGFNDWIKQMENVLTPDCQLLVIMEHTGLYSIRFEEFLQSINVDYCKIPALQIKRSIGVVRGKNDRIDAQRIAEYGWIRRDILSADEVPTLKLNQLRQLLSLRAKMVRDRSGYMTRLKEMKAVGISDAFQEKIQTQTIGMLTKNIDQIQERIRQLIDNNADLKATCDLLRSIKGVGWIVAAYMISFTGNFKRFSNARKFNCYAGLAPFPYQSGSSIRGRSRVSHLANKEAKTILNLAACCAIRYDDELREYYQKRVAEGKRKMSCVNIIRSKLVARMFAVNKRQTPYQPHLKAA